MGLVVFGILVEFIAVCNVEVGLTAVGRGPEVEGNVEVGPLVARSIVGCLSVIGSIEVGLALVDSV